MTGLSPPSGTAWGTFDNDDDLRFNASQKQDGTFEVQVSDDDRMFWGFGSNVQRG
ncbi:hypothetical protein BH23ACT4_BH23ACT4_00060 [soil metagenome]